MPVFERDGQPITYRDFLSVDGETVHLSYCLNLWSDAELAAEGIVRSEDPPPSIAAVANQKRQQLQATYDSKRQRFPYTFGGVTEHLQLRDNTNDARNWMILQRRADKAMAAGLGAVTCPMDVRVESNAEYSLTFQAISDMLEAMENWGIFLMGVSWTYKNAIDAAEAAEDRATLEAMDFAVGWAP